ncbi:hypothetical protein [Polyangium sp. y55x31]|uniref:hypothetical protein n=1 Tax=Polyangium sp. y55x31 TaxID=3042688 RepID=UPI0024822532|nr:hypothetical protein [Polyangium sp. y55x31]MDI1479738.1 hypothetical protein [Polyangium sp. y55x31]
MRQGMFLAAALGALVLSVACSSPDVQQGGGGGNGGNGGGGQGGGGPAMSLLADGVVSNDCAPNDGPWLVFTLGTASTCGETAGSEPQIHFAIYPGNTSMLAAGQSWTFDAAMPTNEVQAWWYANGVGGNSDVPKSASVEVLSVASDTAQVKYSFVTPNGASYAGQADVSICTTIPMCG